MLSTIRPSRIRSGSWDFVVLQEQSQLPSFPIEQVTAEVFPYARYLDSVIKAHNSCAQTIFYMTWGRKNGDFSELCRMASRLHFTWEWIACLECATS